MSSQEYNIAAGDKFEIMGEQVTGVNKLTIHTVDLDNTYKVDFNKDGKSQEWRDAAAKLLLALARENKYIVADMMIIFLESAGYGLIDYSPLGGVFKRAAKAGIISRIQRPTKQALWISKIYKQC